MRGAGQFKGCVRSRWVGNFPSSHTSSAYHPDYVAQEIVTIVLRVCAEGVSLCIIISP